MRQALLEGIAQAFDHAYHQPRGLERIDLGANLDEVAEVPALDELHDQIMRLALGGDVADGHDVGMPQHEPQLAFTHELGGMPESLGPVGVAERLAQNLECHDLARMAMHGAEHPGERAGPHGVEHFVEAVEIARPLTLGQAFELVVGHVFAAKELFLHVLHGGHARAHGGPDLLELPFGQKVQVECPLQE